MLKRAVLHVDIQNDFCPGGKLAVKDGDQVVDLANKITDDAIQKENLIIFSADWHPDISKHFQKYGGIWPQHCIQETEGASLHPRLKLPNGSIVVFKGTGQEDDGYSAFDKSNVKIFVYLCNNLVKLPYPRLGILLLSLGIENVDIDGLATDYCVQATALDATKLGFNVNLISDACRAVNLQPEDGNKAIEEMRQAGAIITTTKEVLGQN